MPCTEGRCIVDIAACVRTERQSSVGKLANGDELETGDGYTARGGFKSEEAEDGVNAGDGVRVRAKGGDGFKAEGRVKAYVTAGSMLL
jgi:hypothetical protein